MEFMYSYTWQWHMGSRKPRSGYFLQWLNESLEYMYSMVVFSHRFLAHWMSSIKVVCQEVPKTTLANLMICWGTHRIKHIIIPMERCITVKEHRAKSVKENGTWGKYGGNQNPHLVESHRMCLIPAVNCDYIGEMVPTSGAPKTLGGQSFYWALVE